MQKLAAVLPRLDDAVAGRIAPASPAEAADFALLCSQRFLRRYGSAVRFYARAFAGDPKLADDLTSSRRYNAACYALLAGRGQGTDAPAEPVARSALRGQALQWLKAELAARAKQASSDKPADRKSAADQCSFWLRDTDLAAMRPGAARDDLPAGERPAWDAFWADVRATIAIAQKPLPTAAPGAKPL